MAAFKIDTEGWRHIWLSDAPWRFKEEQERKARERFLAEIHSAQKYLPCLGHLRLAGQYASGEIQRLKINGKLYVEISNGLGRYTFEVSVDDLPKVDNNFLILYPGQTLSNLQGVKNV